MVNRQATERSTLLSSARACELKQIVHHEFRQVIRPAFREWFGQLDRLCEVRIEEAFKEFVNSLGM